MIRFSAVGLAYPGAAHPALSDVDLTFRPGESVAVAGPSGSGKTTLVRLMNALVLPSSGSVTVDGLDTRDAALVWDIRRRVGLIFQNPDNQFVSTTVEREIAFGMENVGLPRDEIASRIAEVAGRLRLGRLMDRPPHRLSGGEKQRVAIAAVLAMRPACLALDEPTSLLDAEGRREVWDILSEIGRSGSHTVVHVTQFADEIALASRAVVLLAGRVVFDGAPGELFRRRADLAAWGLARPRVFELADRLRDAGYAVPESADSIEGTRGRRGRRGRWSVRIVLEAVAMEYDRGLPGASLALSGVGLSVAEGECVAVIGPTGSGKTTLLEVMAGLARPTAGAVKVDPAERGRSPRSVVGLVYQFPECQFFEDTVFEDVAFGPRRQGLTPADVERRVLTALERASLPPGEFSSRHPLTLSAGEKRRAAVACILALDRPFLLLDEPTAGLDPAGRARMLDLMVKERAAGRAVVVVTHDLDLADAVAERVVLLRGGRVLADGDTRSILGDDAALGEAGLEAPPAYALVALLKARNAPDAARVADAVLGRGALAGARGR